MRLSRVIRVILRNGFRSSLLVAPFSRTHGQVRQLVESALHRLLSRQVVIHEIVPCHECPLPANHEVQGYVANCLQGSKVHADQHQLFYPIPANSVANATKHVCNHVHRAKTQRGIALLARHSDVYFFLPFA